MVAGCKGGPGPANEFVRPGPLGGFVVVGSKVIPVCPGGTRRLGRDLGHRLLGGREQAQRHPSWSRLPQRIRRPQTTQCPSSVVTRPLRALGLIQEALCGVQRTGKVGRKLLCTDAGFEDRLANRGHHRSGGGDIQVGGPRRDGAVDFFPQRLSFAGFAIPGGIPPRHQPRRPRGEAASVKVGRTVGRAHDVAEFRQRARKDQRRVGRGSDELWFQLGQGLVAATQKYRGDCHANRVFRRFHGSNVTCEGACYL